MSTPGYPVHVDATLDTGHLSRWLWLVKWLLAIPHYFLLAFLWVGFFLLSVIAFFAILFTGRYPHAIFDFNVGVMRWSWRVAYYTYGALGTDRYPPFTLAEVPDYPAHLTVDYPEHLSRGLVLIKWWLLAIPHYLIVAFLVGSGLYVASGTTQGDSTQWTWSSGLIGLLVIIAAFALLFTGRYPQQIFDLVLGLNRWVLRVAAYAGLMTDEYPPFRLDMGGQDPVAGRVAVPATPAPPASAGGGGITWSAGRIIGVVLAALVFLVAGGFLAGGTTLAVADQSLRNDAGYLMTPTENLATGSYGIASEPLTIDSGTAGDVVPQSLLGEVAVRASTTDGEELFVGVARTSDAAAYLSGVAHATLVDFREVDGEATPVFQETVGDAPTVLPGDTDIWVASASGAGEQELSWEPESGDWTVVVMNADGGPGVDANVSVGATAPVLSAIVIGLLVTGGILLLASIVIVLVALYAGRHDNAQKEEVSQ